MKKHVKEYGLWLSESSGSYTFSVIEELNTNLLEKDAKLIWSVKADSWNKACQKRNDYLGWGKYIPFEEYKKLSC